jgi:5-dehydro-2-deoxygluconokinase
LEPGADGEAWLNIERTIAANDPLCRGVVLLGLSIPHDELVQSFTVAARVGVVKGFAVGRTIFNGAATRWFKGEIDDAAAVDALADNLGGLVDAWRRAKKAHAR